MVHCQNSITFASHLRVEAYFGRLAQLVQSICLTSRGSAVRIRQRPHSSNVTENFRAFSSAGSEHLPYKQRVGGSNPSTPTIRWKPAFSRFFCFYRVIILLFHINLNSFRINFCATCVFMGKKYYFCTQIIYTHK